MNPFALAGKLRQEEIDQSKELKQDRLELIKQDNRYLQDVRQQFKGKLARVIPPGMVDLLSEVV